MICSPNEMTVLCSGDGKREHTWNEYSIAMIGNIKGYHGNQRTLGNGVVEIVDIYVEPMMVHLQIELDVRCEVTG